MYPWYSEENTSFARNLIASGELPVYWNDVDSYYWVPSRITPSGNVVDFFCYNKAARTGTCSRSCGDSKGVTCIPPKHEPWEIHRFDICPTMEQMEWLMKEKEKERISKQEEFLFAEQCNVKESPLDGVPELLGKCMRALIFLDKEHKKYFGNE